METQSPAVPRLGYSLAEAEIISSLSRATLYRAAARGDLRIVKVGRRSLIPAADLAALCGQASPAVGCAA